VPPRPLDPANELIQRQEQAADDLRRELLGSDGALEHPYSRSFDRMGRDYDSAVSLDELHVAASRARILYVGDFHAVPAYPRFAAALLERSARAAGPTALGVEFVYTRQQRFLDRRQAGQISDDEFLRCIHYDEEWGYPWEGLRDLLDRARALGVEVIALDVPPRGGFSGLAHRDERVARRIAARVTERPEMRLVVLFGETHLAPGHLPRRVRQRLRRTGLEIDEIVVLQSPDRLYWMALSRENALPDAVRIDDRTFAVLHTAPLQKYEAYRQVLERWEADVPAEEELDLTPSVHHLIELLLQWIGIRASHRLQHRAGWAGELIDVFPEVYSGSQAFEMLGPVLVDQGRTTEELDEARCMLDRRGAVYESRSNALFLRRYLPGLVAGESARFLRAALTGRLFIASEDFAGDPLAATYGAAYNEALSYLGSRLVDPTAERFERDVEQTDVGDEHETWLEAHLSFESTTRRRPPEFLCERVRRSRPLRRRVARALGRRVGAFLFERVQAGEMEQRELRSLFARRLAPDPLVRLVLRWLRQGGQTATG
jgi:hypothetical protein